MRGRKKTFSVQLTQAQRHELQRWLRSTTLSAGRGRRARLLLLQEEPTQALKQAAQTAGLAHHLAVIRSMSHGNANHVTASLPANTGHSHPPGP